MHPLLTDLHRIGNPLPLASGRVEDLHPIGGAGPGVNDAAVEDADLAMEDSRGGKFVADVHGGTTEPAVEEPNVGGGNVVDGATEDVDGGAEDDVDGADDGGGDRGKGSEEWVIRVCAVEREKWMHSNTVVGE